MPTTEMHQWVAGLGVSKDLLAKAGAGAISNQKSAGPTPGAQAVTSGALPQPMQADCKPVHGKVKGPPEHLFCAKHGHVVDIKAKTIIAHNLAEYEKQHAAPAAKTFGEDSFEPLEIEGKSPPKDPSKLSPEEKAELAKKQKEEARAKADEAHIQEKLRDPDFVEGIITRGGRNCDNYRLIIADSCRHFGEFAEKKIDAFKEFKKAVAPLELFKSALEFLLEAAAGPLGGEVAGALVTEAEGLAHEITKEVSATATKAIGGGLIKGLDAEDDSVEGLHKAVTDLINKAGDAGEAVSKAASQAIESHLGPIRDKLKPPSKDLSDGETALLRFFEVNDYNVPLAALGVPSPKAADAAMKRILKGMIEKFEEKRIIAVHEALGSFPGKQPLSDRGVKGDAESHANEAMKEIEAAEQGQAPP